MNKKIMIAAVALVLPLSACGDDDNDGNDDITTVDVGDVTDVGDDDGTATTVGGGATIPGSTVPMSSGIGSGASTTMAGG